MSIYAFGTGKVKAKDFETTMYQVNLDFKGDTCKRDSAGFSDGEFDIIGSYKEIVEEMPEHCEVYFNTVTSNFVVLKNVTIKLNNVRKLPNNRFEALADDYGNVFTIISEDSPITSEDV